MTATLVSSALALARKWHGGQTYNLRGKDVPYEEHLVSTARVLTNFGYRHPVLIAAAYLHDVLEDTDCTEGMLLQSVGSEVASIVYALTDGAATTRADRKRIAYEKMKGNSSARLVKLADRIANVEASLDGGNLQKFQMYRAEHVEFKRALWRAGENSAMWIHLDALLSLPNGSTADSHKTTKRASIRRQLVEKLRDAATLLEELDAVEQEVDIPLALKSIPT